MRNDVASRGYGHCMVGGASMLPFLHRGDIVRIERHGEIRPGDIIAAEIDGTPAIHRVVSVTPRGIVCRGDYCRHSDPIIPASAVYGIATVLAPGRRLRGGLPALVFARARFWALMVPPVARSAAAEVSLALRQASGAELPAARTLLAEPHDPRDPALVHLDAETAAALVGRSSRRVGGCAPPPVAARASESAPPPLAALLPDGADVEISPGIYGALSPAERQRLLGRLSGRRVVVWGALAQGSRLRLTSALRRLLRGAGMSVGEPGDAAFPDRCGRWRPFHLFSPEELGAELIAAGGVEVEASVVNMIGGRAFARATARL